MTVQLESLAIDAVAAQRLRSEAEIDRLQQEVADLDAQILAAVKRRSEVVRSIGLATKNSGNRSMANNLEMKVLGRFRDLGKDGHTLAMLLLRLGRGHLER